MVEKQQTTQFENRFQEIEATTICGGDRSQKKGLDVLRSIITVASRHAPTFLRERKVQPVVRSLIASELLNVKVDAVLPPLRTSHLAW